MQEALDEKERLDKELLAAQMELKDTLLMNIERVRDNKKKDEELAKLTEHFNELKEQFAIEIEQLELENLHSQESREFDLAMHESSHQNLKLAVERLASL